MADPAPPTTRQRLAARVLNAGQRALLGALMTITVTILERRIRRASARRLS